MSQQPGTDAVSPALDALQKLAGEKTIYGCALVTDSDFGSVFMSMNTVREAGDPTSYDWDIYSWEYTSDQLNNSKLPGVSKELWRLLDRSARVCSSPQTPATRCCAHRVRCRHHLLFRDHNR